MPIVRSTSLYQTKKELPQLNETKKSDRKPLATSPLINSLKNSESVQNLSISDCSCPICLEVLIEPVVLPCKHELCLPCFKDMMDQTNFLCPMCRMRLSTWARSAAKQNALVDKDRWSQIQKQFSSEIKLRMEGKTAQIISEEIKKQKENQLESKLTASSQHISAQGEIKKEYEEYLRREQERLRLEKEKEESMSLQYIQEILQREEACSINDYLRVIEQQQPTPINQNLPTTSNSNIVNIERNISEATTSTASAIPQIPVTNPPQTSHQPFITPSVPTRSVTNRLLNRVKSSLGAQTPTANDSTDSTSNVTPSYSLRSRASIKRTLDEAKAVRSNLINSINNEQETASTTNAATNDDHQPKTKRALRSKSIRNISSNSSSESISLNGSDISIDNASESTHEIDSKQPARAVASATGLARRRSVRTNKK